MKQLLKTAYCHCLLATAGLLLCVALLASCKSDDSKGNEPDPTPVPSGHFEYLLTVQPDNLQQIRGWGIYPGHTQPAGHITSINDAPMARDVIFDELGINIYRVCLEANCGKDYTATNKVIDAAWGGELAELINYAKQKGFTEYMMSIWTPPYHMKEVYNAGTQAEPNYRPRLKASEYDLFVAYVVDVLKYLQGKDCPSPAVISLQNEPEGGVVATADDIGWDKTYVEGYNLTVLLKKLRTALDAAGFQTVKLGAPESPSYEGSWIFKWSSPQVTAADLAIVDVHVIHSYMLDHYDDNTAANVTDPLDEFHRVKGLIGGESWQTEFSVAGETGQGTTPIKRLQFAMRVFSSDMIWAGHTVWMWWCGWFPGWSIDSPDQQVIVGGDGATAAPKSAMFDALATIFNNVPPGSHVRKVTSNDPAHKTNRRIMNDLVAFKTETGMVIVLVNGSDAQKIYGLSGLAGTTGTLKSFSGNDAKTTETSAFTISGSTAIVTVPKNSVNFIYTN
jgi:hypothetical protein